MCLCTYLIEVYMRVKFGSIHNWSRFTLGIEKATIHTQLYVYTCIYIYIYIYVHVL